MNTTRETVDPAMREACRDVCGEELIDIVPSETRNLMGFYASLRKLLSECGITDFSFSDLTKPTHPRLVKIFSYIINFVRFRESQTAAIDEHFNKLESTKTRIETLYVENQDLDARISSMQSERETMKSLVREKTARNDALKARLLELKKNQERIALEMESARGKKAALTQTLEERTERTVSLRQECEKLRPYASQSTPALQAHLAELSDSLSKDKQLLDLHEKRSRALQTSTDTFILTSNDITPCISLLNSVSSDLATEEQEAQEAAKRRDALAERGNNVREVERTEALLQRQLNRWLERTEAIRKQAVERNDAATERMKVLKGEHKVMVTERGEKGREVERRRVRIEQTEKKVRLFSASYSFFPAGEFPVRPMREERLTLVNADGRSQGEYRERDLGGQGRVHEDGLAYQALHHRDGAGNLNDASSY